MALTTAEPGRPALDVYRERDCLVAAVAGLAHVLPASPAEPCVRWSEVSRRRHWAIDRRRSSACRSSARRACSRAARDGSCSTIFEVAALVRETVPPPPPSEPPADLKLALRQVSIAFVIDTTNSMRPAIEAVRRVVRGIVRRAVPNQSRALLARGPGGISRRRGRIPPSPRLPAPGRASDGVERRGGRSSRRRNDPRGCVRRRGRGAAVGGQAFMADGGRRRRFNQAPGLDRRRSRPRDRPRPRLEPRRPSPRESHHDRRGATCRPAPIAFGSRELERSMADSRGARISPRRRPGRRQTTRRADLAEGLASQIV